MSRSLLVVGQSHVAAFREAARIRRERDPHAPRTRVIHTGERNYAPELTDGPDPDLAPLLADAIADQVALHTPLLVSVTGGNIHNALSLIRPARAFDFRIAGEDGPPIDREAEPIAEALVAATLRRAMGRDIDRLRALRRAAGPFLHVESPPPLADDRLIAERADAWFRENGVATHGVAAGGVRWRMWRLASRLMRTEVEALGCRFVPVPDAVRDVDGFLRPDLAADATHGNAAYGEALIRAIEG